MVRCLILDENFTPSSSLPPPSFAAEVDDAIPAPEGGPLLSSRDSTAAVLLMQSTPIEMWLRTLLRSVLCQYNNVGTDWGGKEL